jgi:hypothetical protein
MSTHAMRQAVRCPLPQTAGCTAGVLPRCACSLLHCTALRCRARTCMFLRPLPCPSMAWILSSASHETLSKKSSFLYAASFALTTSCASRSAASLLKCLLACTAGLAAGRVSRHDEARGCETSSPVCGRRCLHPSRKARRATAAHTHLLKVVVLVRHGGCGRQRRGRRAARAAPARPRRPHAAGTRRSHHAAAHAAAHAAPGAAARHAAAARAAPSAARAARACCVRVAAARVPQLAVGRARPALLPHGCQVDRGRHVWRHRAALGAAVQPLAAAVLAGRGLLRAWGRRRATGWAPQALRRTTLQVVCVACGASGVSMWAARDTTLRGALWSERCHCQHCCCP